MALSVENKIVRDGIVKSGQYEGESVWLTCEIAGQICKFLVHPDTASKFHCGKKFTATLTAID